MALAATVLRSHVVPEVDLERGDVGGGRRRTGVGVRSDALRWSGVGGGRRAGAAARAQKKDKKKDRKEKKKKKKIKS